MGDIIEDSTMVRDTEHGQILRVGFLNQIQVKEPLLESFKQHFDLIVCGDGSLCPVIYSLESLFKTNEAGSSSASSLSMKSFSGIESLDNALSKV